MRRPSGGYELRSHNPTRALFGSLLALLLLAAAGVGLYWVGYHASGKDATNSHVEVATLRAKVAFLKQQNQALLDKNAQLGRSDVIDREAVLNVQAMLNKMQDKLANLSEEVSFYRSIVSPTKIKPGLHLQHFQLSASGVKREFGYHVVLTQAQHKHVIIKGRVSVQIMGQSGGQKKSLDMSKLSSSSLDFSFHYFQDLSGDFVLPKGFVPQGVTIKIIPYTRRISGINKSITWNQAMKGEG